MIEIVASASAEACAYPSAAEMHALSVKHTPDPFRIVFSKITAAAKRGLFAVPLPLLPAETNWAVLTQALSAAGYKVEDNVVSWNAQ
jgi:hypothetical protein